MKEATILGLVILAIMILLISIFWVDNHYCLKMAEQGYEQEVIPGKTFPIWVKKD